MIQLENILAIYEDDYMIRIDPEKGNNKGTAQHELNQDIYSEMSSQMFNICEQLSGKWSNDVDKKSENVVRDLEEYLKKHERILYSSISNYIFGLYGDDLSEEFGDEKIGNMQTNITSVFQYAYGDKFKSFINSKTEKEKRLLKKIPAITLKLLDHINLACQQCSSLKQTDEEYKEKFDKSIVPFKDKLQKEMNAQLLTLVGIFTALSFLLFGGISSLENIFAGIQTTSILKLIILGCIWGLCLVNLIFVFLFCVAKMTNLPFASTNKDGTTIFKKYPIFWWTNYILVSIFIIATILLYFPKNQMLEWIYKKCAEIPALVCFASFVLIFVIMIAVERFLQKACNEKEY